MKSFNLNKYFILYGNCTPVKGASRSIICDFQNGKYFYIPNGLYDLIDLFKSYNLNEIYSMFEEGNHEILDEYFHFLISNNFGFFDTNIEELNRFPKMKEQWFFPGEISNSLIDINVNNPVFKKIDFKSVFCQLENLGCITIQLRLYEKPSISTIKELLKFTENTRLRDVRLVLPFDENIEKWIKDSAIINNNKISEVIYFNCKTASFEKEKGVKIIKISTSNITKNDCGNICSANFAINIKHFTEAKNFNTCLNKKISIDEDGLIKNCPTQKQNFGSIIDVRLSDILLNDKFKNFWELKKDDIEVCKDCEFRYICTDCRFFTNEDTLLGKPSKCSYDPYNAKWN